jgi:hypothetical protein
MLPKIAPKVNKQSARNTFQYRGHKYNNKKDLHILFSNKIVKGGKRCEQSKLLNHDICIVARKSKSLILVYMITRWMQSTSISGTVNTEPTVVAKIGTE